MIDKNNNTMLCFTISKKLHEMVTKEAAARGISAAGFIRMILLEYFNKK